MVAEEGVHQRAMPTLSVSEQKLALSKLLEKKRKTDLAGLLRAQREGTKMAYLARDMAQLGITQAAFSGGGGGGGGGRPEPPRAAKKWAPVGGGSAAPAPAPAPKLANAAH